MKGRWLNFHRWAGLKLSILLSFILITGALAVVSHEIDWLIDPAQRVLPAVERHDYDWQALADAATTARPDWAIEWIAAPAYPWFAAEVVAITPAGEQRRLLIHPRTFELQGDRSWLNAQRLLRDTHRRLMMVYPPGIALVASLSILLLMSLATGIFVYKKFWRGFFRKPRARNARTFWGDLHRLGGVWSIWFISIIGVTAFWYFLEATGEMIGAEVAPFAERAPPQAVEHVALIGNAAGQASLTELAAIAREALPGYEIRRAHPAHFHGDAVEFHGQTDALLVRDRGNVARIDPYTGHVLGVIDGDALSAMQRVSEMADPLHFGTFGGLATRLLYFVFGVVLSAMSLSGVYIFSSRIRKAQARKRLAAQRLKRIRGAPEAAE